MSESPIRASGVKSQNISWAVSDVTREERAARNGHRGMVLWLTSLSGSEKSSLSRALERELFTLGMQACILDGDNVRHGLNRRRKTALKTSAASLRSPASWPMPGSS